MSDDRSHTSDGQRNSEAILDELDELLEKDLDDDALFERLRSWLDQCGSEQHVHVWGPALDRRDRERFKPLVLEQLEAGDPSGVSLVRGSERSERLREWLRELEADGDIELFRALHPYTIRERGSRRTEHIESDLLERYRNADDRQEREQVLQMFDVPFGITAETALELYTFDPDVSGDFVRRHLGGNAIRGAYDHGDADQWERLREEAQSQEDDELYFELYRRHVSFTQWKIDARRVMRTTLDPDELVRELERRHPSRPIEEGLGSFFANMFRKRDRDVLPYIARHLDEVMPVREHEDFFDSIRFRPLRFAYDRRHWELWAELLSSRESTYTYNAKIRKIVGDDEISDAETSNALRTLAETSTRWTGTPRAPHDFELQDRTATEIYEQFPPLIRGPFRLQLSLDARDEVPSLLERALEAEDREVIDECASRVACLRPQGEQSELSDELVEPLMSHYTSLLDEPETFVRRAAEVLGRIDEGAIRNYRRLIDTNPLTELFFERTEHLYATDPPSVRDLLEADNSYVRGLAYRVLSRDEPEAKQLADEHLDMLRACLLQELPSRVRRWGFDALLNAARDRDDAEALLDLARRVLRLPDEAYPTDALLMFVARLLQRWPPLRRKAEQPTVYEWRPT